MPQYQKYYTNETLRKLDPEFLNFLCETACDKSATLGLVTRTNDDKSNYKLLKTASIALTPSPIPEAEFNKIWAIQPVFNELLSNIVNKKPEWITSVLKEVKEPFLQKLIFIRESITEQQYPQIANLQIMRNDYMCDPEMGFKNIEYNTIASSIGGIMTGVCCVQNLVKSHVKMMRSEIDLDCFEKKPDFANNPLKVADKMEKAHRIYCNRIESESKISGNPIQLPPTNLSSKTAILFVIEDGPNWNMGDMRKMEFDLNSRGIFTIRKSLSQLSNLAIDLYFDEMKGRLFINDVEISLVYFRAGYQPEQYKTEADFKTRLVLERSRAIKCPSIDYHLIGFKRIQIELSKNQVLEDFFTEFNMDTSFVKPLKSTFANMWQASEKDAFDLAMKSPEKYVLKEQMEGGSEIIVGAGIPRVLAEEKEKDCLEKWVVMDRIRPIEFDTVSSHFPEIFKAVSEVGVYTSMLDIFEDGSVKMETENCGYLVRSKQSEATSGGFAIGVASADELYFV